MFPEGGTENHINRFWFLLDLFFYQFCLKIFFFHEFFSLWPDRNLIDDWAMIIWAWEEGLPFLAYIFKEWVPIRVEFGVGRELVVGVGIEMIGEFKEEVVAVEFAIDLDSWIFGEVVEAGICLFDEL